MSDISIRLTSINTPGPEGRVNLDTLQPGRTGEIRAGVSNIGVGQILILDADDNPEVFKPSETHQLEGSGWEVRAVGGVQEREHVASYTLDASGKVSVSGDKVPFEEIRAEHDAGLHFNQAHMRYTEGLRGEVFFRKFRVKDGVKHYSEWLGADDGRGFRIGSQV